MQTRRNQRTGCARILHTSTVAGKNRPTYLHC
jgi:hypothetical protein